MGSPGGTTSNMRGNTTSGGGKRLQQSTTRRPSERWHVDDRKRPGQGRGALRSACLAGVWRSRQQWHVTRERTRDDRVLNAPAGDVLDAEHPRRRRGEVARIGRCRGTVGLPRLDPMGLVRQGLKGHGLLKEGLGRGRPDIKGRRVCHAQSWTSSVKRRRDGLSSGGRVGR